MADIEVFVDGTDRSNLVDRSSDVGYDRDLNGQGNGSFTLADLPSGFVPAHGMEVLIKENSVDVFGGTIRTRPRGFRGPDSASQLTFYEIEAATWEQRLNKRRVWRKYVDETFEDIVADINTDFLNQEGFTLSVLAGSTITITFNGQSVAECFDLLCSEELDDRVWYITPDKVITIDILTGAAAPTSLDATNVELNNPAPTIEPDETGYANVITVVGGNPDLPILFTAEDQTEITARKAAEGGSGIYHDTVEDNEIVSAGQAEQRAEGILLQRKQLRQRFVGMTDEQGFEIGQTVTINLPNLDITAKAYTIIRIETTVSPGVVELWHTITAVDGPIDGSWQSEYRRKINPKTIPMQIEATPGLVRVEPEPGVLIHDPPPAPFAWFQAVGSTPTLFASAFGLTHDGTRLVTLRLGGLAGTGGCPGGQYPGFGGAPACFANRQVIMEIYGIDADNVVASTPADGNSIDAANVGTNFKAAIAISPDDKFALVGQMATAGVDSTFYVYDLVTDAFRGQVVSNMLTNANLSEPVWIGDHVYFISGDDSKIYTYDITDPDNPVEASVLTTTVTAIRSLVSSPDGSVMYGSGLLDIGSFDLADPDNPVEDTVLTLSGAMQSLDINDAGDRLLSLWRANSSAVGYNTIAMTVNSPTIAATTSAGTVPVAVGTIFDGLAAVWRSSTIIAWRSIPGFPVNSEVAHVFDASDPDSLTFIETITYTHGGVANQGPFRNQEAAKVYFFFGGVTQQITYGVAPYDEIVPYTIEKPLRPEFGGTGIEGENLRKGDLLAASGPAVWELLSINPVEGAYLRTRAAEDVGMAWEAGLGMTQVAIDDTDSPYGVPAGVDVILADATAGPITITPPNVASSFERFLVIKNDGDGSNAVTVDPFGIETIDGQPTKVLVNADDVFGMTASVNEWEVLFDTTSGGPFSLRGYIDGLVTAWVSTSEVMFFPGVAADVLSGNEVTVIWDPDPAATTITKSIASTWVEGDGNGGLASGTVAASTEYNLILITKETDGTIDFLFDVSPIGAGAPVGWTARRRLGSIFTDGSSNVREYDQHGDRFTFRSAVPDVADLTGTLGTYETATVTTPGNQIAILYVAAAVDLTTDAYMRLRATGTTVDVAGNAHAGYADADAEIKRVGSGRTEVPVDAGRTLEYTMIGAGAAPAWSEAEIFTQGWIDDRGRDAIVEEELEDMWVPASSSNVSPFGEVGNVSDLAPDPFANWVQHNAAAWDDGGVEGMSMTIPVAQWAGKTVEVFFMFSHVSATAGGGSLKDIRVQLDVGPRADLEAEGTPGDGASFQVLSTLEVAPTAGANQNVPRYLSVGTFDVGAGDKIGLFEFKRLGTDGLDTFNASIGAFACHLVPQ